MGQYLMGLNIGTQSIRVQIYDERLSCVAAVSTPQFVETPCPGWSTQSASGWWEILRKDIPKALAQAGLKGEQIYSVGCTAHMHGVVPVGREGKLLMEQIQIYSDKRGASIAEYYKHHEHVREFHQITGNVPLSNWFGIKIRWLKEHMREIYEDTRWFLTPSAFINYWLTGEAYMDPSEGSGSFLMDWRTDCWSDRMLEVMKIDREKLPEIVPSGQMIGRISGKAAEETGLSETTRVYCGGGDMLHGLYISGLHKEGNLVDSTGTGSVLCSYNRQPLLDTRVMNLRNVLDGFVTFGENDASGVAFRWLRDVLAKKEKEEAAVRNISGYDYLSSQASNVCPGSDGLFFLPYLMGERTTGTPASRGCFIGLNLGTELSHMVRAVLEGVAFDNRMTLDIFKKHGVRTRQIFLICGGARGELWNQIKADIYGMPVYTLMAEECEALGAALLGSVDAGWFDSLEDAAGAVLKKKKEYVPDTERMKIYNEYYEAFKELHNVLQPSFEKIKKISGHDKPVQCTEQKTIER